LPRVRLIVEEEPVGTAGTVGANRWFVEGMESFWVFYADNLTDVSLRSMLATHRRHRELLTMGLFRAPDPSAAGIVEMDREGRIVSFEEKPQKPRSNLANAGIFLARATLFAELPERDSGILDFGFHVLPRLLGRMHGHVVDQFLMDIGTPTALAKAAMAWGERGGPE
jgi:mannose-1-phosphate guanylyltransferase